MHKTGKNDSLQQITGILQNTGFFHMHFKMHNNFSGALMFIKVHLPFMPGVRIQCADLGLCMDGNTWDYFEGINFKNDFIFLLSLL